MKRRAFTLTELLMTIPLMLVVLWLLTELFVSAVRETPALQRMAQTQNSLCRLAERIQADADAANTLSVADQRLTFSAPAGRVEYFIFHGRAQRLLLDSAGVMRITDTWELPNAKIDIEPLDGAVSLTTFIDDRRGPIPQTRLVLRRLIRPQALGAVEAAR